MEIVLEVLIWHETVGSLIEQKIADNNKPVADGESTEINVKRRMTDRINLEIKKSILGSRLSPLILAWVISVLRSISNC